MDLSKLTPEQLAKTPLIEPPLGHVPNFEHPESRASQGIALVSFLIAFMLAVLIARLCSRFLILKQPGLDDAMAVLSAIAITAVGVLGIKLYQTGPLARRGWDVSVASFLDPSFQKRTMAFTLGVPVCGLLVKLTILILLQKVFPYRVHKKASFMIWTGMGLVTVFNLIALILLCVWCVPKGGMCQARANPLGSAMAGFNVFIDLYIFAIPVPIIRTLNIPRRRKIGAIAVLGTGLIACICSILTLYYRIQASTNDAVDPAWNVGPGLTGYTELSVGLITASLPCLPALWNFLDTKGFKPLMSAISRISLTSSREENSTTEAQYTGHYTNLETARKRSKGSETSSNKFPNHSCTRDDRATAVETGRERYELKSINVTETV